MTDAHPRNIADESMRLLIPLSGIRDGDFKNIDYFFRCLADFVTGRSDELLAILRRSGNIADVVDRYIDIEKWKIPGTPISINMDKVFRKALDWVDRLRHNSSTKHGK